jgi:hypothetical protein
MSNDINVQALSPTHPANGTVIAVKATVIPPPEPQQTPTPSQMPNPSLRLDPVLGLVVIEFRSAGVITRSFPSQSQLEAYKRWDVTRFGPSPSGRAQRDGAAPSGASTPTGISMGDQGGPGASTTLVIRSA